MNIIRFEENGAVGNALKMVVNAALKAEGLAIVDAVQLIRSSVTVEEKAEEVIEEKESNE